MKKIKIKDSFLILLSVLFFLDEKGVLFLFLLAAAAHELGHFLALCLCGGRFLHLELNAAGALMRYRAADHPVQRLCIAAAGPAASFLCAALAARGQAYTFAGANVLLGAFNLLPVQPLDGWTALGCILAPLGATGERLQRAVSVLAAALLTAVGGLLFVRGWGAAVLGMGAALLLQQKDLQITPKRDKINNIVIKLHSGSSGQCEQRGDADVLSR
ncbi:MAG: M50 family metallopeptidase [Intestinibacillus sp.]